MAIMRKGKTTRGKIKAMPVKKYQEGGRIRAGNPGQLAARRLAQQYDEQEAAQQNEVPATAASAPAAIPSPPPPAPAPIRRRTRATNPQDGMADQLNERVLYLTRGGTPRDEIDRRLASAMGLAFKKGGLIKTKKK